MNYSPNLPFFMPNLLVALCIQASYENLFYAIQLFPTEEKN